MAIVLAQNKEVKRQLSILKKALSVTRNSLVSLTWIILLFFYFICVLIGEFSLFVYHVYYEYVHWHPSWYCHCEKSARRKDIWPVLKATTLCIRRMFKNKTLHIFSEPRSLRKVPSITAMATPPYWLGYTSLSSVVLQFLITWGCCGVVQCCGAWDVKDDLVLVVFLSVATYHTLPTNISVASVQFITTRIEKTIVRKKSGGQWRTGQHIRRWQLREGAWNGALSTNGDNIPRFGALHLG